MSRNLLVVFFAAAIFFCCFVESPAQNRFSGSNATAESVRKMPRIQAVYTSAIPEVDGRIPQDESSSSYENWVPVLNADWDNRKYTVVSRFKTAWNEEGLYLAAVIPGADPARTMSTGRTPDAPFELLLNLDRRPQPAEGEEGRYFLRFVPMITEPSKMIYRSQAFQFNHRFGDNTRLTDPGPVIWKELSLSGIEPEGIETRWAHLNHPREEGMSMEIFIPWKNIGITGADAGDSVFFNLEVNLPESARDSWTGTPATGHQPDGEIGLLPPGDGIDREIFLERSLVLQTKGEVITDITSVPVAYPLSGEEKGAFALRLVNSDGEEVTGAVKLQRSSDDLLQADLKATGIKDGTYRIQIAGEETGEVIAERAVFLAGERVNGEFSERKKKLSARLDSIRSNAGTLNWEKGQLARAEYALDLSENPIRSADDLKQTEQLLDLAGHILHRVADNRRPDSGNEGYLHPVGFSADGEKGPVTFVPSGVDNRARLTVRSGNAESWEVNPLIYGTFSEPVIFDRPIYDLLYAQRLRNPGFEWGHPTFETTLDRYSYGYGEIDTASAGQIREGKWVPVLTTDEDRVAAPWFGAGSGNVSFALHDKAYNTKKSQKITLRGNSGFAGVAQVTDLPVWREQNYQFETWLRTDEESTLSAKVKLYHGGKVIDEARLENISPEWSSFRAELSAPEIRERQNAFLVTIELEEEGSLYVDQTTLYPADHINGMDPQVIKQVRELNTGWMRWPGGNFASAYHWKDGVGPLSERTGRINPSWIGLTPQLFGTDEYMHFSRLTGMEPLITVNAGDGTPGEAARWVEYTNGSTDTPMGRLRAENGHPEPYDVTYWNIGNELWGHWQVGYCTPAEYAERYKDFVREMDKVDPSLEYVAIGWGPFSAGPPVWMDILLEEVGEDLDIIDLHPYVGIPDAPELTEEERVKALTAVPVAFEKGMMEIRRKMSDMGLEDVEIAIGEYNSSTWNIDPEWRETTDLLSYAGWLHAFMRQGDYIMGANATEYSLFDPRALVFDLMHPRYELFRIYREFAGSRPVRAELETPVGQSPYRLGMDITPVFNLPQIDAVVLSDPGDGSLGVGLMNRSLDKEIAVEIDLQDFSPGREAVKFQFMDENMNDHENSAAVKRETIGVSDTFTVTLPARSVSLIKIPQE